MPTPTTTCSQLAQDFMGKTCEQPIAGTNSQVILINYDDINRSTIVKTNGIVSALSLNTGKKGYSFTNTDGNANIGSFTFNPQTYTGGSYVHTVSLKDFIGNADAYKFVSQLKASKVVAIIENRFKGDTAERKYTIYGLEAGLKLKADSGTTELSDGIVATIELSSSDNCQEPNRPINLFVTDESATDTMVKGLLIAAA